MTHIHDRDVWYKEGIAALISGVVYGITNVISGSPFDVIKTRMQVCDVYAKMTTFNAAKEIWKTDGFTGFFKGITGPMFGSSIFRSVQFASYEAFYGYADKHEYLKVHIPLSGGLEIRVIFGGIISGTSRALIECPFEFMKVRRQIGLSWEIKSLYHGFQPTWFKAMGLMTTYFILLDNFRRKTNVFKSKVKLFFVNGFCASFGFLVVWPFEIVKNRVQGKDVQNYSVFKEIGKSVRNDGIWHGLFRGIGPGLTSVFIRNGCSMLMMQQMQKIITKIGFRKSTDK